MHCTRAGRAVLGRPPRATAPDAVLLALAPARVVTFYSKHPHWAAATASTSSNAAASTHRMAAPQRGRADAPSQ